MNRRRLVKLALDFELHGHGRELGSATAAVDEEVAGAAKSLASAMVNEDLPLDDHQLDLNSESAQRQRKQVYASYPASPTLISPLSCSRRPETEQMEQSPGANTKQ